MYRLFLIAILITVLQAESAAQDTPTATGGSNFDPVVFLSTLKINQFHGRGNIRPPTGTRAVLVDSVRSNEMTIGFSMFIEPDSGDGWNMWIDFDADRYYRPRLVRVFAQRRVEDGERDAFSALQNWVQAVQGKNIGDPAESDEGVVRWPWLRNTDYYLVVRSIQQHDSQWLTMALDRIPIEE